MEYNNNKHPKPLPTSFIMELDTHMLLLLLLSCCTYIHCTFLWFSPLTLYICMYMCISWYRYTVNLLLLVIPPPKLWSRLNGSVYVKKRSINVSLFSLFLPLWIHKHTCPLTTQIKREKAQILYSMAGVSDNTYFVSTMMWGIKHNSDMYLWCVRSYTPKIKGYTENKPFNRL